MGIFDIFGTGAQEKAAQDQIAGLQAGYSQASDLYGQGRAAVTSNYGAALQPFLDVYKQTQTGPSAAGYSAYADATGANGTAGLQKAGQLFQQTPGYQSGFDLGADAIDRRAASRGMLGSGNTNLDTIKFANDYGSQKYGQYVAGLAPFTQQPTQALQAASGIAGVQTGQGNALNQSYQGQGGLAYQTQTGVGNANANADLASLTASGNIFGALMNGGKLASSLMAFSDERLKEDIEPVGELFDGQPIYRYRYIDSPRTHIGLIAQDVEHAEPDAVGEFSGMKMVDYAKATDFAAKLAEFV